ncbi:insulin-like growth factor-binding protein-related protein 1 [Cherax quadricarinatus]|nr:insulin-like growth factor-binding protein-related protein 1 isoform X1 [Cherax quadricarinatus]
MATTAAVAPLLLLCFLFTIVSVEGKEKIDQCKSCSVVRCAGGPETMKCTYGIVKDWCGCCYTCGLGPGSPCGRDVGVCGTGLVCRNGTCVLSRIRQG